MSTGLTQARALRLVLLVSSTACGTDDLELQRRRGPSRVQRAQHVVGHITGTPVIDLSKNDGVVYAAFGSHCDQAPAVRWIAGVSTSGQLTTLWTTEAGANKTALGSVWAPGALASDGSGQILFVTGNGVGSKVTTGPGSSPPAALPESAVRLTVQSNGSLKATDYFSPYNTATLDSNDWDFGSSKSLTTQGPITPTNGSIPNQPGLSVGTDGYVYFNFTAGSASYSSMACW